MSCDSPRTRRRSNRNASEAFPFTRPDCLTSVIVPLISAFAGRAVIPEMMTAFASDPWTGSSIWLVVEPRWLNPVTLSDVPAGTTTSRNCGGGGATGFGGGGGAAGAAAAAAAAAAAGASGGAAGATGLARAAADLAGTAAGAAGVTGGGAMLAGSGGG